MLIVEPAIVEHRQNPKSVMIWPEFAPLMRHLRLSSMGGRGEFDLNVYHNDILDAVVVP